MEGRRDGEKERERDEGRNLEERQEDEKDVGEGRNEREMERGR